MEIIMLRTKFFPINTTELISSEGLEHLTASEDGKTGPVMVAVSKNGFSALHLTMPASTRALSNPIGTI